MFVIIQYSLKNILLLTTFAFISTGFSIQVDLVSYTFSHDVFGYWDFFTVQSLRDWGMSPYLVATYATLSLMRVPGWIVMSMLCGVLGSVKSRHTDLIACSMIVAVFFTPHVVDIRVGVIPPYHLHLSLIPLAGTICCLLAWLIGRRSNAWIGERYRREDRHAQEISLPFKNIPLISFAGFYVWFGFSGWRSLLSFIP